MTSALAGLTGSVRTLRPGSRFGYGIPWSNVTRYEPAFTQAAAEFSVPVAILAGMAVIESDANQTVGGRVLSRDDGTGIPSVGLMQVKPYYWQYLVPEANPRDASGNIRLGAAVMRWAITEHGSWEQALVTTYFPYDDPNGTSQNAYVKTLRSLIKEIEHQVAPVPETPPITPPTETIDPVAVIVGGGYPAVDYGFRSDVGLNFYRYGVGHGTQAPTEHTGIDVGVRDETVLYTPIDGEVLCVGWRGTSRWGQGCGYFEDEQGGVGNLTILGDKGHKLTLGHCSRSFVDVGDRVSAGQRVATSGVANGAHVHIEVVVQRNGTYWLLDPVPALLEAMGGHAPSVPVAYAVREDLAQPDELPPFWIVRVVDEKLAVRQRGNPDSPRVAPDLVAGEEFHAQHQVVGLDGLPWWVSTLRGRVSVAGTELVGVQT